MNRLMLAALVVLLPVSRFARADDAAEATKLAVKLTAAGAATFDTKDARAMAASYLEDAQLEIVSKDKDTGAIKSENRSGRAEIEDYYRELFKNAGAIHSRNEVEYARRVDPDLLVIAGVFHPDLTSEDLKVPFVQVRQRHGEKWLISRIQIFVVSQN